MPSPLPAQEGEEAAEVVAFLDQVAHEHVLSTYVRDVLLDPRTLSRPHLTRKNVEAAVNAHLAGRRNYTREIHTLLTIELVYRLFATG